jgi:hypothetical protein
LALARPAAKNRASTAHPNCDTGGADSPRVANLEDAARRLVKWSGNALPFQPTFVPLRPPAASGPVAAVDGSHAVIVDNGATWVAATRATAVTWPSGTAGEVPVAWHLATPDSAEAMVAAAAEERGLVAPTVRSGDSYAEAMRGFAEFDAALAAVGRLPRGGLLLIDGALEGLPRIAQAPIIALREAAQRGGVTMVGVSKRSAIEISGVPLVPGLQARGPPGVWACAVPGRDGVFVARLHGQARHAFRVDAAGVAMVEALLPLSRDAVYTGYPYPLAAAHNAVALTASHVAELRGALDNEVRRHGGAAGAGFLDDFHDVLDRAVPG